MPTDQFDDATPPSPALSDVAPATRPARSTHTAPPPAVELFDQSNMCLGTAVLITATLAITCTHCVRTPHRQLWARSRPNGKPVRISKIYWRSINRTVDLLPMGRWPAQAAELLGGKDEICALEFAEPISGFTHYTTLADGAAADAAPAMLDYCGLGVDAHGNYAPLPVIGKARFDGPVVDENIRQPRGRVASVPGFALPGADCSGGAIWREGTFELVGLHTCRKKPDDQAEYLAVTPIVRGWIQAIASSQRLSASEARERYAFCLRNRYNCLALSPLDLDGARFRLTSVASNSDVLQIDTHVELHGTQLQLPDAPPVTLAGAFPVGAQFHCLAGELTKLVSGEHRTWKIYLFRRSDDAELGRRIHLEVFRDGSVHPQPTEENFSPGHILETTTETPQQGLFAALDEDVQRTYDQDDEGNGHEGE
ncbi:hypothetical protein [Tahibacter amnicola]|uniref:Trypsin-like peptidase n=1 Tax=Tahibacter amnicola TaxID=2976241 RepID=A0ABY6BJ92_9GAMM|nr:hypothetical protein [Tahibacter amnicola]UXI69834.1 hypothetical protein N4264_09470 [Tahibacter amnicola]